MSNMTPICAGCGYGVDRHDDAGFCMNVGHHSGQAWSVEVRGDTRFMDGRSFRMLWKAIKANAKALALPTFRLTLELSGPEEGITPGMLAERILKVLEAEGINVRSAECAEVEG